MMKFVAVKVSAVRRVGWYGRCCCCYCCLQYLDWCFGLSFGRVNYFRCLQLRKEGWRWLIIELDRDNFGCKEKFRSEFFTKQFHGDFSLVHRWYFIVIPTSFISPCLIRGNYTFQSSRKNRMNGRWTRKGAAVNEDNHHLPRSGFMGSDQKHFWNSIHDPFASHSSEN